MDTNELIVVDESRISGGILLKIVRVFVIVANVFAKSQ